MFAVNLKVNLNCALIPFFAVLAGFFLCMNSQFLILLPQSHVKIFLRTVELLVCLTADYRLSGGKVGKGSCDLLKAVFGNCVMVAKLLK